MISSHNDDDEDYFSYNLPPPTVQAIKSLWSDEGFRNCYQRRGEYRLTDSAR